MGVASLLRVLLVGSGGSGAPSYVLICCDLALYGLAAAWRWALAAMAWTPSPPSPPPLPAPPPAPADSSERLLVSVVIPAFNEGDSITAVVQTALRDAHAEVIVADGGSTDETRARARAAGALVVDAPPGRASCQNAGAAAARGALLLFVHGDTLLPDGYGALLRAELARAGVAVAAFRLTLHPRLPGIAFVEWGANRRSARRGLPYGDQGLGLRRDVFEALGGFPAQPFLEDVHLVLEARRRRGEVVTMGASVRSSARRWELHGVVGNTLRNQLVLLGYVLGVPVPRIAEWYYGARGRKQY